MNNKKQRLFTGIQPTGSLHIGNYLGAILPAVNRQDEYDSFLCVVDLHSITKPYEPKDLRDQIKGVVLDYIAGGIDPDKSTLFIQSHVPQHCELMWLLNTITPVGELQRMIQYKEFKERFKEPQGGILNYPILMAADVLLYKGEAVPVGDDQTQHIELMRDLAKKFNRMFGDTFPIPKNTIQNPLRIMSMHDPDKKMSKSLGPKSYIAISDNPDTIRKKIMSAVTGTDIAMTAGTKNLFTLLEQVAPKDTYNHMYEKFENKDLQYSELKAVLADYMVEFVKPIQEKRAELENNLDYIASILAEGSERARKIASETIEEVKQKMGLM